MILPALNDAVSISFPLRPAPEAVLAVYEYPAHVPFPVLRVFTVTARVAVGRGAHAHKQCQQLLVCLQGAVDVTIDDGQVRKRITLTPGALGFLIPAGLWAEQNYTADAILMVLASHGYDEADYIRDYKSYQAFRGVV